MVTRQLFVIFKPDYSLAPAEFVKYWKDQYEYPNMHWYSKNIVLSELSNRNLYDLFCWKNGMNLSQKKQKTFHRISQHIDLVNQLKTDFQEPIFTEYFGWLTPVWKIFLRHIINPNQAPIFDQHVYRAYRYIQRQEKEEKIPSKIEELYLREYVPFFWGVNESCEGFAPKEIDDALWAFGKFLSLYPNVLL